MIIVDFSKIKTSQEADQIFFSETINSTVEGESHSAASVRETLKNLITK